jgi:SAM-dependent methyltransferase
MVKPIRKLAGRIYQKLFPIVTHHADIRVYASVAMQTGDDHLHYGYWENDTENIRRAQDNLYKKVRALIPSNARTVLDVGGGIGGTSNQLIQDGYDPLCIVPDRALISMGRKSFPRVRFLRGSAEYFRVRGKYDVAVMLESYQYFTNRPKALSNIVRHLANHGCIIVSDEFSLISDPVAGMPKEEDLLAQMQANNYYLETRVDITDNVLPTCRIVYERFEKHISQLAEQWRTTEKIYWSGRRRYLLLLFKAKIT